ncbi:MAG: DNA/RNA nuclease SfsA [Calditerrivibrio sp.]|nr:DNA/RNA nuclease SfsA [Calditerrivibrio sp.]
MLYFGRFVKRYKRFFVEVEWNQKIIVCHNPNTGSMKNLLVEGAPVCFSESLNPKRSLKYTLEGIYIQDQWIHTNTIKVNSIVYEHIRNGSIIEFQPYFEIKHEYRLLNKRLDFYIESFQGPILVEVKSVSLFDDKYAMFPDAKTKRGLEHLQVLKESIQLGYKPYLLYLIQSNRSKFRCAEEFDKKYCEYYYSVVPKYIKPLFYRNIFDPYKNSFTLTKIDIV